MIKKTDKKKKDNSKLLWIGIPVLIILIGILLFVYSRINYCGSGDRECITLTNLEKYCKNDGDCLCGKQIKTGACFYGNKNFVSNDTCPDFCSGIGGNLEIKCIENECKQVNRV